MTRGTTALALVASLACGLAAEAQVRVELRGGAPDRTVAAATPLDRGLEVRTVVAGKGDERELIPWDEVRAVTAADSSGAHPAREFMQMAEELWRARIRIARRDTVLARPLLERHWERFRGADGPTAQLVAEGLLRCAVNAGDLSAAVGPWIACLRLGTDGTASRFPALEPVLDDTTGLLPVLAPFAPEAFRADFVKALDEAAAPAGSPAGGNAGNSASAAARVATGVSAQMARLLRAADAAPAEPAPKPSDAPASRLLAAIDAIATAADARARERAVADFDKLYPEPSAFVGAWRLAAAGLNSARLARAAKPEVRSAALIAAALDNLAVPASGLDKTGLVDAYALEEAERLVREAGDAKAADALAAVMGERLRESGVRLPSALRQGPANPANQTSAGVARPKGP